MKFKEFGNDRNDDQKHFVPYGDVNASIGKIITSIEMREDHEDLKITLQDGTELRIFGSFLLPSYSPR